ncbi:hypothetical protein RSAG8_05964, partial [Rhizoctonia solani AG-8 WAC10335]
MNAHTLIRRSNCAGEIFRRRLAHMLAMRPLVMGSADGRIDGWAQPSLHLSQPYEMKSTPHTFVYTIPAKETKKPSTCQVCGDQCPKR